MDFRITLTRPPLVADFEVGSIAEAVGVLEQENSALMNMFRIADSLAGTVSSGGQDSTAVASGTVSTGETTEEAAPGKPPRKSRKDAAAAVAPAPLPVPTATTTLPPNALAPPDMTPGPNGIPAALDRTKDAAAPPPPLLPSAPSIAPPPPPPAPPTVGILGAKVVAALEARKPFPDEGKALVDWLAAYGLVVPGCTYDQACEVVLHLSDEKLAAAAGPQGLNVAA